MIQHQLRFILNGLQNADKVHVDPTIEAVNTNSGDIVSDSGDFTVSISQVNNSTHIMDVVSDSEDFTVSVSQVITPSIDVVSASGDPIGLQRVNMNRSCDIASGNTGKKYYLQFNNKNIFIASLVEHNDNDL